MVEDQVSSPAKERSLCFSEASAQYRNQQISWEDYLRHCLMHFVEGFPIHAEDERPGARFGEPGLKADDPFAHALWCWQSRIYGVKDVSELEAVFQAYRQGSLDDLKARLSPLHVYIANTMRRALAHLALRDRRLDVLRYVLNDGQVRYDPVISSAFEDKALAVRRATDPELFDVIHQSTWKNDFERGRKFAGDSHRGNPVVQVGAPKGTEKDFDHLW